MTTHIEFQTASTLISQSFPTTSLAAAKMISVLADQTEPAELVDAVRDASESFDLNHQGLVFISPLSRIYVEGEVDAPGSAAYYNPVEKIACKIEFGETIHCTGTESLEIPPEPQRDGLQQMVNSHASQDSLFSLPAFHIFSPPGDSPNLVAISSKSRSEPGNFCASYISVKAQWMTGNASGVNSESRSSEGRKSVGARRGEISSTSTCPFASDPTNSLTPVAAEAEIRSLSFEDCVAQLSLSINLQETRVGPSRPASGQSPNGGINFFHPFGFTTELQSASQWLNNVANSGLGDAALADVSETAVAALKSLRRILPVHKQKFDWNIHKVAGVLPPPA